MDDFLNAAQQLTKGEGDTKQYGFVIPRGTAEARSSWSTCSARRRCRAAARRSSRTLPTRRLWRQPARWSICSKTRRRIPGWTTPSPAAEAADHGALTGSRRAGMWFAWGLYAYGPDRSQFTMAMAPPPLGQAVLDADDVSSSSMYISAQTDKQHACWTWLTYISSSTVLGASGNIPARRSVAHSDTLNQEQPGLVAAYDAYAAALDRASQRAPGDDATGTPTIDDSWLYQAIDRALQGAEPGARSLPAHRGSPSSTWPVCAAAGMSGPAASSRDQAPSAATYRSSLISFGSPHGGQRTGGRSWPGMTAHARACQARTRGCDCISGAEYAGNQLKLVEILAASEGAPDHTGVAIGAAWRLRSSAGRSPRPASQAPPRSSGPTVPSSVSSPSAVTRRQERRLADKLGHKTRRWCQKSICGASAAPAGWPQGDQRFTGELGDDWRNQRFLRRVDHWRTGIGLDRHLNCRLHDLRRRSHLDFDSLADNLLAKVVQVWMLLLEHLHRQQAQVPVWRSRANNELRDVASERAKGVSSLR